MTQPVDPAVTPMQILAQQARAIEQLTTAVELMQGEIQALRRRLEAVEGVPWPEEPPDPD